MTAVMFGPVGSSQRDDCGWTSGIFYLLEYGILVSYMALLAAVLVELDLDEDERKGPSKPT